MMTRLSRSRTMACAPPPHPPVFAQSHQEMSAMTNPIFLVLWVEGTAASSLSTCSPRWAEQALLGRGGRLCSILPLCSTGTGTCCTGSAWVAGLQRQFPLGPAHFAGRMVGTCCMYSLQLAAWPSAVHSKVAPVRGGHWHSWVVAWRGRPPQCQCHLGHAQAPPLVGAQMCLSDKWLFMARKV